MKTIKKFLYTIGTGALIGAVLFAWFSPVFLRWYGTPPVSTGINCEPMIGWAIDAYRLAIVIGLGLGAVLASFVFVAFLGRGKPAGVAPQELEKK